MKVQESDGKQITSFDPYCEWKKGEKTDTLELQLPGFKKEQLNVTLDSDILKISGEREVGKKAWMQFKKTITDISKNHKADAIEAKFENAILCLTLPKNITPAKPEVSRMRTVLNRATELMVAVGWAAALVVFVYNYYFDDCHRVRH